MDEFRIPRRRPRRRIYRFLRSRRKPSWISILFLIAAAVCLAFGLAAVFRSARTARQNESYAVLRQEAEASSAPAAVRETKPALVRMTYPDGSPIPREERKKAGGIIPDTVAVTTYHRMDGEILPAMAKMREINRDLAAWLTIDNVLDLPVVYRDNEWYMNHDFEGGRNGSGTLFLDEDHPLTGQTQTLLIHGHNMKDGSMFAVLPHYRKADYWRKHPFVQLTTLREKERYVVFAAEMVSTDPKDSRYLNYFTHSKFGSDSEFEAYIAQVKALSVIPSTLSVKPEDALLELSTCVGEDRMVVFARRIRENEYEAGLRSLINDSR